MQKIESPNNKTFCISCKYVFPKKQFNWKGHYPFSYVSSISLFIGVIKKNESTKIVWNVHAIKFSFMQNDKINDFNLIFLPQNIYKWMYLFYFLIPIYHSGAVYTGKLYFFGSFWGSKQTAALLAYCSINPKH